MFISVLLLFPKRKSLGCSKYSSMKLWIVRDLCKSMVSTEEQNKNWTTTQKKEWIKLRRLIWMVPVALMHTAYHIQQQIYAIKPINMLFINEFSILVIGGNLLSPPNGTCVNVLWMIPKPEPKARASVYIVHRIYVWQASGMVVYAFFFLRFKNKCIIVPLVGLYVGRLSMRYMR